MLNAEVNPGMFEHVTKMGRIGGSSQTKGRSRAQFRQIPYHGPAVPVVMPGPQSVASSSPSSKVRTVVCTANENHVHAYIYIH